MGIEDFEKAKLIKEAIKIVDELAESDLVDIDGDFNHRDFNYEMLQKLINNAKKLKRNTLWKLT